MSIWLVHRDGEPLLGHVYDKHPIVSNYVTCASVYHAKRELWERDKIHFESLTDEEQDALVEKQKKRYSIVEYVPIDRLV